MDHIFTSGTQDSFEHILKEWRKKNWCSFNNNVFINETENRITFKIKTGYYLKLLTPETMKLLRCTKIKTTKNENGENSSKLEITEVVLVNCNLVNNYLQNSRVMYKFFRNKSFRQLLDF